MRPEFTKKPEFMRLAAEQKRNSPPFFLEFLILLLLSLIASITKVVLGLVPELAWMLSGDRLDIIRTVIEQGSIETAVFDVLEMLPAWLIAVIGCLSVAGGIVAILYCRIFEKRRAVTMGLCRSGMLLHLLFGIVLGLGLTAAIVGVCVLFRGITVTGFALQSRMLPLMLLFVLSFAAQSFSDTLLLHGFFGVSLNKRYRLPICLALPALAYMLVFGNALVASFVGMLNLVLIALLSGLLMLYQGDLWSLFGVYFGWNLLSSGILLQTPDLDTDYPFLLRGEIVGHNDLLTGGSAGLGGSLCATLVLLAGIGVLICLLRGRPDDTVLSEEFGE